MREDYIFQAEHNNINACFLYDFPHILMAISFGWCGGKIKKTVVKVICVQYEVKASKIKLKPG